MFGRRKHTLGSLKEMVAHQREKYGWEFMFLGADIDAYGTGASMGVSATMTANFGNNSQGYAVMAHAVASSVLRGRNGESMAYTPEETAAMNATVAGGTK